jgi:hypothetical protein
MPASLAAYHRIDAPGLATLIWPMPTPPASPPQGRLTALHLAAGNGHVDLIDPLLAMGADIEAKDINVHLSQSTPL